MQKKVFVKSILFTFIWGIIGHAYGLLNFTISHDSLEALYSARTENAWKISLGRFFVPLYRTLTRGPLTAPWLIGMLALIWIGISSYLVIQLFNLKSDLGMILTTGILTVNPVVCALIATYLHDFDVDMFALLLMVLAVYFWEKKPGAAGGMAAIFIASGLGLYQSYLSVAIVLILMILMLQLINGKKFKDVFLKGTKACFLVLAGGGLYLILMKLICFFTNQTVSESYNSISRLWNLSWTMIFRHILQTYYYFFIYFTHPVTTYSFGIMPFVNLLLGVCVLGIVGYLLFRADIGGLEKLLLLCMGILLPVALNVSYILSDGTLHGLMMYAFCLVYLFALLIVRWFLKTVDEKWRRVGKNIRILTVIIVFLVFWNNIILSNAAYLKKDLERQQMLSLMTRVVAAIEEREDYVQGETRLAFVGKIQKDTMEGFELFAGDGRTSGVIGLNENIQIKNSRNYEQYFRYVLNIPVNLCESQELLNLMNKNEIKQMPVFPAHGSIEMIDGTLVIKMGEV